MDSTSEERGGASNGGMLYHEVQESQQCAVHCVNTASQGPFFSEFDLAALASDMDRTERQMMLGSVAGDYIPEVSPNVSLDGDFSIQMSNQRIMIRYGGRWDRAVYVDGVDMCLFFLKEQISLDNLVSRIRTVLRPPPNIEYMLYFFTRGKDARSVRAPLLCDEDVFHMLDEQGDECLVFVIELEAQQTARGVDIQEENCDPDIPSEDEKLQTSEDEEEVRQTDLLDSLTTEWTEWIRQPRVITKILSRHNMSSSSNASGGEQTEGAQNAQHSLRNWIIPLPEFDPALPLGCVEPPQPVYGQLVVGATFRKKLDLKIAVGLYHMKNMVECVTDRSSSGRVTYVCKQGRKICPFRLCSSGSDNTLWRITKLNLNHECRHNLGRTAQRQVSSKVAATYFARQLVDDQTTLKPKTMMSDLSRLYDIHIDYNFALRTRNLAVEIMYGDYQKSYQRLPSYLHVLKECNPGTHYDFQTNSDGVFCHMFVALGQCIRAFQHTLRPVIVVDATHLKGKNSGVLFVAVTKDGNENIFPLAFGIGSIENDEEWTWFLQHLRVCYDATDDLLIVSDQHKSISNAIRSVYPHAARALCYHQLSKNLARYGSHLIGVLHNAAYSYRVDVFEKYLSDLEALSRDGAYKRLLDIGVETWARSKCVSRRYGFMTSNAAECFNDAIKWPRRLPVCSLLESIRAMIEKWFDEKRKKANERHHVLTDEAFVKLSNQVELSRHFTVQVVRENVYNVHEDDRSYLVDITSRTCECREFDLDLIPCRHAAAAIKRAGFSEYDFVSHYFKQSNLVEMYATPIMSLPHYDDWVVPPEIASCIVLPPVAVSQAGRSRMSRARSTVENAEVARRVQVCSRCKGVGHNKRVCKAYITVGGVDLNVSPEELGTQESSRKRQKKKCSICRNEDHTITKCPMRTD